MEKWQTGTFLPDAKGPAENEPALGPRVAVLSDDMLTFTDAPQEIKIVDEEGNPILAGDEDRRYFEGPWVHKYNGYYYLSYSTGTTHCLVYAMSEHPQKDLMSSKARFLRQLSGGQRIIPSCNSRINGIYFIMIVPFRTELTTNAASNIRN